MSGYGLDRHPYRVHDDELLRALSDWFDHDDELAHRRTYQYLLELIVLPKSLEQALGSGSTDDLCHAVLVRLLDRGAGALRKADNPVAYARRAVKHEALQRLRSWKRAAYRDGMYALEQEQRGKQAYRRVEDKLDMATALEYSQSLSFKLRMAVLLLTRPACISQADWDELVAGHSEPSVRPTRALDREQASLLLYPTGNNETPEQRLKRRNTFDRAFSRAMARLRQLMREGSAT